MILEPKYIPKLAATIGLFTRYGLADFATQQGLKAIAPDADEAASLGQVHSARLRDGRGVVVKVQRPHIREQLADDLEYFRELATFLSAHTEAGARIDMIGIIQQLERAL